MLRTCSTVTSVRSLTITKDLRRHCADEIFRQFQVLQGAQLDLFLAHTFHLGTPIGSSVRKTSPSRWRKICFPSLQTQEGWCRIRRRHQHPLARTTLCSGDGEASCMGRVFTVLLQLKDGCLHTLSSRFARWTKPHISSDRSQAFFLIELKTRKADPCRRDTLADRCLGGAYRCGKRRLMGKHPSI